MTTGDLSGIKCPACKANHRPPVPTSIRQGEVFEILSHCPLCQKEVRYWARQTVAVEAEREDRVK